MALTLPNIYPITDCRLSGLSHCEQVKRLIEGGASLIQLREKETAPREFYDDALPALLVAHTTGAKIIINDRVDIALALKADGVHLGQRDMPVTAARLVLGNDALIGYSTHNIDQVKAALHLPINYVAFGPIFSTSSKAHPDPVAGVTELIKVKELVGELPLVAIGGIDSTNVQQVIAAGADSAALISAVLSNASAIARNLGNLVALAARSKR